MVSFFGTQTTGRNTQMETPKVTLDGDLNKLTQREREVLIALAQGYRNKEIASYLGLGIKTIDTHRGHLRKKLSLRNNSDMTRYAIKHGLIDVYGRVVVSEPPVFKDGGPMPVGGLEM